MPQFETATPEPAPAPTPAPEPDASTGTDADGTSTDPPAEADASTQATQETPAEEVEETPSFDSIESAVEEIKKLRRENARRRVEKNEVNEVFEKFGTPEERESVLKLAEQIATDPLNAKERLQTIINRIDEIRGTEEPNEAEVAEAVEETAPEGEAAPSALTPEDVERLVEERLAAAEEERQIQEFYRQAGELGYEKDSAEYAKLLHYAAEADLKGHEDPLTAGHERIEAEKEAIRREAIEEYRRSVAEGRPMTVNTGTSTSPPSPTAPTNEVEGDPKDWNAARKRAEARLKSSRVPAA